MIYDPYTTMTITKPTTTPPLNIPKARQQPFNSYEDGIDNFDGPLWHDAMDPISTQLEAEGRLEDFIPQPRAHVRRDSGSRSPIEKIKFEEEYSNETIPAMWNSEQPKGTKRHHQRRPSLLSRLMSDCEVRHESEQHCTPKKGCDFCGYKTGGKQEGDAEKMKRSSGEYFQVQRGSW